MISIPALVMTDELLLALVGASATLLGLFLVGVFFFVDSPVRRSNPDVEPYLRAGTGIVLVLYAIPLIAPLVLIVAGVLVATVLYAICSFLLVVQNVRTLGLLRRIPSGKRIGAFVVNEIAGTALLLVIVVTPWLLGGLRPTAAHLGAGFVVSLVAAFISTCAFVVSAFDLPAPTRSPGARGRIARIRMSIRASGHARPTPPHSSRRRSIRVSTMSTTKRKVRS